MTREETQAAPFEAAHWDLVPGGTALVVIDAQNDFLHPDGWYARRASASATCSAASSR